MIRFSLSTEDADLVMRALQIQARIEESFGKGRRVSDNTKRIRRIVKLAVDSEKFEGNSTSTPRIEEIHTKGGIEICPAIS